MNILMQVCRKYGVRRSHVRSPQARYRFRPALVSARLEAARRLRDERRLSWRRIGELLNRNECTIRYWLDPAGFREAKKLRNLQRMRARLAIGHKGYKNDATRRRAESVIRSTDLRYGDKMGPTPQSAFCPPGLSP